MGPIMPAPQPPPDLHQTDYLIVFIFWANVADVGPELKHNWRDTLRCGFVVECVLTGPAWSLVLITPGTATQQIRDFDPVLVLCWPNVDDGGPTLKQRLVNISCLLGATL